MFGHRRPPPPDDPSRPPFPDEPPMPPPDFPGPPPPPHHHRPGPPHHHHHRPGPPPFFPPMGPFPPGPFQEQDPFGKTAFKDLKYFFILTILEEIKDGVTGYQLQGKFNFGRGNLVRMLDELEENGWVSIEELVVQGRAQKKYKINDSGKKYLEDLKKKWAEYFTQFADMAPPEEYGRPEFFDQNKERTFERLLQFSEKEDALDFIRGIRSKLKDMHDRLQFRLEGLDTSKAELDELIKYIEAQPNYDKVSIKSWLEAKKQSDL